MSDRWIPGLACVVLGILVPGGFVDVAAANQSIWDGVYSVAQAERGGNTYAERCSACHGDFLDGGGVNRRTLALSGATFAESWESASLNDLFAKIGRTMPQDAAGSLTSLETLDLIAFLLQYNEYPAGSAELRETPELALIDIVGRDGPQPLRHGALVRTVGCLAFGPDPVWTLTRASAPVRTKSPGATTGADLERARATTPGSLTIGLANLRPGPDVRAGTRVEARGLWLMSGGENRITIMSLQIVDDTCE